MKIVGIAFVKLYFVYRECILIRIVYKINREIFKMWNFKNVIYIIIDIIIPCIYTI